MLLPEDVAGTPSQSALVTGRRRRIMLVGSGFHFLGGLSVYTCSLANALADSHDVSVLLLNRLIPTRLYPGGHRAGEDLTSLRYDPRVEIVAELDWFWGPSIARVAAVLRREKPDVIVLQWWTAATLHTYLMLARLAARHGIPLLIEIHELQDTAEAQLPLVARYCRRYLRRLVGRSAGVILHNQHDAELLKAALGNDILDNVPARTAPHGPYDHIAVRDRPADPLGAAPCEPDRPLRVLFFGLIRPYKGLEDLICAFNRMRADQAAQFELCIVGETWNNWTLPAELIAASAHRERIRFVNRYVSDAEAAEHFGNADVLVLPYRRGSASGPLHIAMTHGIRVVLYAVGGLVEAVRDYEGATLVPPGDVTALSEALLSVASRPRERFADPHSWAPLQRAIETLSDASDLQVSP